MLLENYHTAFPHVFHLWTLVHHIVHMKSSFVQCLNISQLIHQKCLSHVFQWTVSVYLKFSFVPSSLLRLSFVFLHSFFCTPNNSSSFWLFHTSLFLATSFCLAQSKSFLTVSLCHANSCFLALDFLCLSAFSLLHFCNASSLFLYWASCPVSLCAQ